MVVFDTSVWVEFFKGTEKGAKVKTILEMEEVYTCAISLAEITKWGVENGLDILFILEQVKYNSIIIDIEEDVLIGAGRVYGQIRKISPKISLIDVIIYVSALVHGLRLLTKDTDFENLANVKML